MIVLILILFAMFFISMGSIYEAGYYIELFLFISLICIYIAHIFLLALAVGKSAKRKELAADRIWTVLTFIFGLPAAVIFELLTFGINRQKSKENKKSPAAIAIISLLLSAVFSAGFIFTERFNEYYTSTHFTTNTVCFETEDGKQVIYDKMGNAYTRKESEYFKYYDRNGKTYIPIFHYDLFASEPDVHRYNCIEDDKIYDEFEYDFVIDSDGYFVIFPAEKELTGVLGVYYDKNGNIYYHPGNCYWMPDGKLAFDPDNIEKITYQDILDYNAKNSNYQD